MNKKRFVISVLAVFAFVFLFEWFFHGYLLKETYIKTASLWRTETEMHHLFPAMLLGQFLISLLFCYIFTKGYEGRGTAEGLRYGVLIGLLMSAPLFITYAVQPIPLSIIAAWILGTLIEASLAGMLLGGIYRPK